MAVVWVDMLVLMRVLWMAVCSDQMKVGKRAHYLEIELAGTMAVA